VKHRKIILKSIPLVLMLALIVSISTLHYATAEIYQNEFRTELDVYNGFGTLVGKAIVGHVITIDTSKVEIIDYKAGTLTAQTTTWGRVLGWSAEWNNPWWHCSIQPYDSTAEVKISQKISSWFWSEEGDLWNYVYCYGGNYAYTTGAFIGTAGGNPDSPSLSQIVDLATIVGEIFTIILGP